MNIISSFFSGKSKAAEPTSPVAKNTSLVIPQDSTLKRHFLTQLRADIENTLVPKETDPGLKHYYEAAVAAEFQKRLSDAQVH